MENLIHTIALWSLNRWGVIIGAIGALIMGLNELSEDKLKRIEDYNLRIIDALKKPRKLLSPFTPSSDKLLLGVALCWSAGLAIVFVSIIYSQFISHTSNYAQYFDSITSEFFDIFFNTKIGMCWLFVNEKIPRWIGYGLFFLSPLLKYIYKHVGFLGRSIVQLICCVLIFVTPKLIEIIVYGLLTFAAALVVTGLFAVWITICITLFTVANCLLLPFHAGHILKRNAIVKNATTTAGLLITIIGFLMAFAGTP